MDVHASKSGGQHLVPAVSVRQIDCRLLARRGWKETSNERDDYQGSRHQPVRLTSAAQPRRLMFTESIPLALPAAAAGQAALQPFAGSRLRLAYAAPSPVDARWRVSGYGGDMCRRAPDAFHGSETRCHPISEGARSSRCLQCGSQHRLSFPACSRVLPGLTGDRRVERHQLLATNTMVAVRDDFLDGLRRIARAVRGRRLSLMTANTSRRRRARDCGWFIPARPADRTPPALSSVK